MPQELQRSRMFLLLLAAALEATPPSAVAQGATSPCTASPGPTCDGSPGQVACP